MLLIWNIIRWVISVVLLVDGALFLCASTLYAIDVHRYPEKCTSTYGRLSNGGIIAIFGGAGIACLALLFITVPL